MTIKATSKLDPPNDTLQRLRAESLAIFVREALVVLTLAALLLGSAYAAKTQGKKAGVFKDPYASTSFQDSGHFSKPAAPSPRAPL